MFDLNQFENELNAWVKKAGGEKDGVWTHEVKKILVNMAPKTNGIEVCASGAGANWGEWLCDVTWLQYSGERFQRPLLKMLLAAESEWGDEGDILDDFEKLLVCRADVRVMIFDDSKKVDLDKMITDLKTNTKSFAGIQNKDYFVFAYYKKSDDRFVVQDWYYQT